jgi:hypothetical protein
MKLVKETLFQNTNRFPKYVCISADRFCCLNTASLRIEFVCHRSIILLTVDYRWLGKGWDDLFCRPILGPTQPPIQKVSRGFLPGGGGYSGRGVKLTTQHRMLPRLGMNGAVLPLPLYALMVCTGTNLLLPFSDGSSCRARNHVRLLQYAMQQGSCYWCGEGRHVQRRLLHGVRTSQVLYFLLKCTSVDIEQFCVVWCRRVPTFRGISCLRRQYKSTWVLTQRVPPKLL